MYILYGLLSSCDSDQTICRKYILVVSSRTFMVLLMTQNALGLCTLLSTQVSFLSALIVHILIKSYHLFQTETDNFAGEAVFFDPNDTWTKESIGVEIVPAIYLNINGDCSSAPTTPRSITPRLRNQSSRSRSVTPLSWDDAITPITPPRSHKITSKSRDDRLLARPDSPIDYDDRSDSSSVSSVKSATPRLTLKRSETPPLKASQIQNAQTSRSNSFRSQTSKPSTYRARTPTELKPHLVNGQTTRARTPQNELSKTQQEMSTTQHEVSKTQNEVSKMSKVYMPKSQTTTSDSMDISRGHRSQSAQSDLSHTRRKSNHINGSNTNTTYKNGRNNLKNINLEISHQSRYVLHM